MRLDKLMCIAVILVIGCSEKRTDVERSKLYDIILDKIVYDNYYQQCLDNVDSLKSLRLSGGISAGEYERMIDSLKAQSKDAKRKCTVKYIGKFNQTFEKDSRDFLDLRTSVQQSFFSDDFGRAFQKHESSLMNTLTTSADIEPDSLHLTIAQIDTSDADSIDSEIGTIAISQVYFNKEENKAVVYYEFICGPLCGHGQLALLEKKDYGWDVIEYIRMWDI